MLLREKIKGLVLLLRVSLDFFFLNTSDWEIVCNFHTMDEEKFATFREGKKII